MDKERIKLYRDRGASSLRNNSRFKLYARQIAYNIENGTTIVQRLRRASSTSMVAQNSYSLYENDQGECSKNEDIENNETADNRTFRKISVSKRRRRGKNSVSGFTKLHDLEEEEEEIVGYDARKQSTSSMGLQSIASLDEERVNELDEDLAVLEQKGYYMESDIEEEDENEDLEDGQSSHGSNADFEDSSSSEDK